VPKAHRIDYFAAALSEAIVPLGLDRVDPASFEACMSFARLDSIGISKASASAHRSFRGPQEFARTGAHSFCLLMAFNCPVTADHRGKVHLMPGDIFVHDSSLPVSFDVRGAIDAINLVVTENWLRRWIPNPSVLVGRRIAGQSPWGTALCSYIRELSPELVASPPLPLAVIADQVGSLLALTAGTLSGEGTSKITRATRSLHAQIADCIAQRCTEPQFCAADVAVALNISVRTLHRTLAASQETFGSRLIDARIAAAVRMLSSPLFNRVTTAEIGRRAGFVSASHFARIVRHRTGRTPLQYRRSVTPARAPATR
jgi:AraC-like DNA-binding protein